ncbi:Leucine-rich repeat and IQ domain-containing protein 1 [Sciurus carolinensis]|uniref:Leucine-rich repeat and IQ domain-containing protein 1 n=1 Tax=Sciurus carolinensis TaxID=30640 RepID=A0AA41SXN7_SCICA|nr:Leucine-rich repeat and IQ domain-containing protein 1 [Sciurus carolinensis]
MGEAPPLGKAQPGQQAQIEVAYRSRAGQLESSPGAPMHSGGGPLPHGQLLQPLGAGPPVRAFLIRTSSKSRSQRGVLWPASGFRDQDRGARDFPKKPGPLRREVTNITFQDLPGCSLSTLAECTNLQFLSLRRCGLTSLQSLNNCKNLKYIDVQENHIVTINCENLENLCVVLLNKNQLSSFHGLDGCINIQNLELSYNKITRIDLTSAIKWFDACCSLRELTLTGNPLLQEINWRHSLLEMLPALKILNGDMVNSHSEIHSQEHCHLESRHFRVLCQSEIREFNLLIEKYINRKGDVFTLDAAENFCYYFKKLMTLSNEYRYAHEHGDISITKRNESETQKNHLVLPSSDLILQDEVFHYRTNKHKGDSPGISEQWMDPCFNHSPLSCSSACEAVEERSQEKLVGQKREESKTNSIPTKRISFMETEVTNSLLRNHQSTEQSEKIRAAIVIQAHWRGYTVRMRSSFSVRMHTAATEPLPNSFINIQTVLKKEKRKNTMNIQEQREKAAVLIQAVWKGFILRKKLTTALEAIKNEESEEEYEEVDLQDFTFGEARLVSREDTDLDLFSMTSGSALSVNREKKSQAHRYSAGSSSKLWFPSELI